MGILYYNILNMTTIETSQSKKEEFRKYLEKTGVVDQITRVLVGLYEQDEKPNNAVDYVKKFLGAPTDVDVTALKSENDSLKKQNKELKTKIQELEAKLQQYQEE